MHLCADRNLLVDQPYSDEFAPFDDARCKIASGQAVKSRDMYFAVYQALAEDERRVGLFKSFPPDFFDLVIVDECHRGSARRPTLAATADSVACIVRATKLENAAGHHGHSR